MNPVYDQPAEPPGVSGLKINQNNHTGLYHLECNFSARYFQLVTNTIINEMTRLKHQDADPGSMPVFTPSSITTQMDDQTGCIHYTCDLDLHYVRLVIDALEKEQRSNNEEFDVFISYAHEDEGYVEQLVKHLRSLGIKVWLDKSQVHWGDHHRSKMDYGIRHSKYSIVLCSSHYFSEYKFWTKTELNAAYEAESIREHQILPLWHHITGDQLYHYSSMLASRDHLDTSDYTPLEIAVELLSLLHPVNLDAA